MRARKKLIFGSALICGGILGGDLGYAQTQTRERVTLEDVTTNSPNGSTQTNASAEAKVDAELRRATHLLGMNIRLPNGQVVGSVQDMVILPDGSVMFITQTDGSYAALPFGAFTFSDFANGAVGLSFSQDVWSRMPRFSSFAELNSAPFQTQLGSFFQHETGLQVFATTPAGTTEVRTRAYSDAETNRSEASGSDRENREERRRNRDRRRDRRNRDRSAESQQSQQEQNRGDQPQQQRDNDDNVEVQGSARSRIQADRAAHQNQQSQQTDPNQTRNQQFQGDRRRDRGQADRNDRAQNRQQDRTERRLNREPDRQQRPGQQPQSGAPTSRPDAQNNASGQNDRQNNAPNSGGNVNANPGSGGQSNNSGTPPQQ